jgi:hypothetical protein
MIGLGFKLVKKLAKMALKNWVPQVRNALENQIEWFIVMIKYY